MHLITEIEYEDEQINIANETKFLGPYINNNLSWKTHIEIIKNNLSSAFYVMRLVKPYVTTDTLKVIYYSFFHSIMSYGLYSGGTPQTVLRFSGYKRRLSES